MDRWIAKQLLRPFASLLMAEEDPEVALARPFKLAFTSLIPFAGPNVTMYLEQDGKWVLYWVLDTGLMLASALLLFIPLYILFKLFLAVDVYVLAKRKKNGRTLRRWEFFWN